MRIPRLSLLIIGVLVSASLWAFIEIADEVLDGGTHEFDAAVLTMLRQPQDLSTPIGPRWLQESARDITSLGGTAFLTLLTCAAAGYLLLIRQHAAAVLTVLAVGGGALLSSALKNGFDRPRPDLVPHAVEVYSASFPSGHAMLATVTYLTLGALIARVQSTHRARVYLMSWAIFLSVIVGASRIYLGVHWPTDVLAGWCLGFSWALLWSAVELGLQRRGVIDAGAA